jgi:hypothetical protein
MILMEGIKRKNREKIKKMKNAQYFDLTSIPQTISLFEIFSFFFSIFLQCQYDK